MRWVLFSGVLLLIVCAARARAQVIDELKEEHRKAQAAVDVVQSQIAAARDRAVANADRGQAVFDLKLKATIAKDKVDLLAAAKKPDTDPQIKSAKQEAQDMWNAYVAARDAVIDKDEQVARLLPVLRKHEEAVKAAHAELAAEMASQDRERRREAAEARRRERFAREAEEEREAQRRAREAARNRLLDFGSMSIGDEGRIPPCLVVQVLTPGDMLVSDEDGVVVLLTGVDTSTVADSQRIKSDLHFRVTGRYEYTTVQIAKKTVMKLATIP